MPLKKMYQAKKNNIYIIPYLPFYTTLQDPRICYIIKIITSTESQDVTEFCQRDTRIIHQTEGKIFVLLLDSENYLF